MKLKQGPVERWRKKDWSHWDHAMATVETCGEKRIYRSFDEAEEMRIQQEGRWGIQLRVYSCPTCGYHHLTSKIDVY